MQDLVPIADEALIVLDRTLPLPLPIALLGQLLVLALATNLPAPAIHVGQARPLLMPPLALHVLEQHPLDQRMALPIALLYLPLPPALQIK